MEKNVFFQKKLISCDTLLHYFETGNKMLLYRKINFIDSQCICLGCTYIVYRVDENLKPCHPDKDKNENWVVILTMKLFYSYEFGFLSFDDEKWHPTITSKSINVQMSMLMPMQIGVRTVKLSFYQNVTNVFNFKTLHQCTDGVFCSDWVLQTSPCLYVMHYLHLLDTLSL